MKLGVFTVLGLLASTTSAMYQCPITMPGEPAALEFAYSVQKLLYNYYQSVPVNTTFFDTLPMGAIVSPLDNMTMSANVVSNLEGLQNQAMLGVQGLSDLGSMYPGFHEPSCMYTYPAVINASSHIMNAYFIEATLCGAFIGLADYVQTPSAAFLMARLAAEHGIHASFLGSYMKATPFPSNSKMLTPAFTPAQILGMGTKVGMLGNFLGSCVPAPPAPCNGTVQIGDLNAVLLSAGAATTNSMGTGATMTSSSMPQQATSNGVERSGIFSGALAGSAALAAMVL